MEKIKTKIDDLMRMNGIENQQRLLIRILHEIYPEKDCYKEAEKQKGNFSKMLSGERPLRADFVIPMEKLLNTSLYEIQSGNKVPTNFRNKGIRYAAFEDDLHEYQNLNQDGAILNYDEYDRSALDYIFEYHSINGLRFISERYKLQLDFQGKYLTGDIALSGDMKMAPFNVLSLVCEKGDADLFDSIFDPFSRIGSSGGELGILTEEMASKMILGSEKIFNGILTGKKRLLKDINRGLINETDEGLFVNPLLFSLTQYVLPRENDYPKQAKEILKYGIAFNEQSARFIMQQFTDNDGFKVSDEGFIMVGRTIYGTVLTTSLDSQPDLSEESYRLLEKLNKGINELSFKSRPVLGGFSENNVRVENGYLVKKSTGNETEYEFLKLMEEHGISWIPKLIKQENGLDYLTFFQGTVPGVIKKESFAQLSGIVKVLRTMNDVSKERLGNGKVYVHDDFSVMNMAFSGDILIGIIDWDTTKVGEEYEDLIYLLWTGLNIGDYLRDDEDIFKEMKDLLKVYGATEELKKDWADKMINVMNNRLKRTQKEDRNYRRIFEWIGWSKVFVDLYRDRITKEIG